MREYGGSSASSPIMTGIFRSPIVDLPPKVAEVRLQRLPCGNHIVHDYNPGQGAAFSLKLCVRAAQRWAFEVDAMGAMDDAVENRMQRQSGAPLECRGVLAYRDYRLDEVVLYA